MPRTGIPAPTGTAAARGESSLNRSDARVAQRISLICCGIAVPWIVVTRLVLEELARNRRWMTLVEAMKGVGFNVIPAVLVYLRSMRNRWRAVVSMKQCSRAGNAPAETAALYVRCGTTIPLASSLLPSA